MSYMATPVDLSRIAAALDLIQLEIEDLGGALCRDPVIVASLMAELQGIDRIAQHIRGIAAVLRSEDPLVALEAVGLEGLKRMLLDHGVQLPN